MGLPARPTLSSALSLRRVRRLRSASSSSLPFHSARVANNAMGIVPRNSFRPPVPFLSSKWELSILLLVTGLLWRAARKVTHLVVFPWVAPRYLEYICQNLTCGCWSLERRRGSPNQLSRTRRQMANIFSTFVTSASPVKHNPCRVTRSCPSAVFTLLTVFVRPAPL